MANNSPNQSAADHQLSRVNLGYLVFLSRWLQAPLYFGLIVAQAYYVWRFMLELWHLVTSDSVELSDNGVLLAVLALVDVVMIANLLIMVIIGGYETFVARLRIGNHPDQPEWLNHVNANVLKVKLAMAIVGISSIHLLATFINATELPSETIMWQVIIHLTFVFSAVALAFIDRISVRPAHGPVADVTDGARGSAGPSAPATDAPNPTSTH
ncbi:MAG: TIGR00645 family protein [Candidatus Nanopelagicales bacterium]